MTENIVMNKSFALAIWVVKCYQFLWETQKEFVLSKQLLRSETAVGALVREAEHAESKTDFKHKMSIAQKEINEGIYRLELLKETDYLTSEQFQSIHADAVEIIKLLTSILNTTKANINN